MQIAQIRYFVTAAQLQNLSKAAEALHLSQPSLSRSIARLEEELGTPLFTRSGKRILLNEPGRRFLESARAMLRDLDDTLLELGELSAGPVKRLSVGCCGGEERVAACLAAFAHARPGVEFQLDCRIEELEVPDINKYDMLLCPDDSRYEKFRGYPLGSERYLLALPAHHPLARREPVDLKALEGQPMVFLSSPGHWLEEPYYLCAGLNLHPATRCLVNDREGHRQVVAAGLALGFVPEGAAAPYRADSRIALARLASGRFARPLMLCFKREKHLSPVGLEFQAFALDFFGVGKEGDHAHRHDP